MAALCDTIEHLQQLTNIRNYNLRSKELEILFCCHVSSKDQGTVMVFFALVVDKPTPILLDSSSDR
jgi:hypothetical protein